MTESCGIHTLARRFCIGGASRWQSENERLGREHPLGEGGHSDAHLAAWRRRQVLEGVLEAVERHEPDGFAAFGVARAAILADVWAARDELITNTNAVQEAAIADERAAMARRIEAVTPGEATRAEPLFYRRTLSEAEVADLVARQDARWELDWQRFPIADARRAPNGAHDFRAGDFAGDFGLDNLRAILVERGVERVFEWREWGRSVLVDVEQIEISYSETGLEGAWCDDSLEWIVFASHDDSLLLGGWLCDEVKRRWPEWEKCLWRPWW